MRNDSDYALDAFASILGIRSCFIPAQVFKAARGLKHDGRCCNFEVRLNSDFRDTTQ